MNVYIIALVFGIGCGLIGLFMGCKFSNDKVDDIVSENYDLQKENEWLREQNEKLKSDNTHKIAIDGNGVTIVKDNKAYQYIGNIGNNIEFTNEFCNEL